MEEEQIHLVWNQLNEMLQNNPNASYTKWIINSICVIVSENSEFIPMLLETISALSENVDAFPSILKLASHLSSPETDTSELTTSLVGIVDTCLGSGDVNTILSAADFLCICDHDDSKFEAAHEAMIELAKGIKEWDSMNQRSFWLSITSLVEKEHLTEEQILSVMELAFEYANDSESLDVFDILNVKYFFF